VEERGRRLTGLSVAIGFSLLASPLLSSQLPALAAAPLAAASGCVDPIPMWPVSQRVEQLIMVSGSFTNLSASASAASAGVGGFVFYNQPPAGSGPSTAAGLSALASDASIANQVVPLMSTDEEGGDVQRLSNVIGSLPSARSMAANWSPAQVQSALTSTGSAMRSLWITIDLAPVLDVAPATDTVADESTRSFSNDRTSSPPMDSPLPTAYRPPASSRSSSISLASAMPAQTPMWQQPMTRRCPACRRMT
jgi:beta-N-acetylhexosaminidase